MSLTDRGFPLMLTFDLDGETMWTSRDPAAAKRPILLSQGAYGWKTGVPRILEVLRRYDIKSTFFVPGLIVEQRPHVIEKIVEAGHEIAHHSYSHAWIVNLTHEQEREEMEKGFEAIKRATGKAPRGYRAPASEFSDITLGLIKSYGFGYSSKRHIFSKSTGREARSSSYRSVGRSSMLPTSNIRSCSRAAPCIHRQRCWRRGRQSSTCSIQKI
jgi:peptidoglycan/xylan/chitin deacetylase (PgdA/CDA1 family)